MTTTVHTALRSGRTQRWTCDDHSQYVAGCQPCQARSAARYRQRSRLIAYGTWHGMVNAAPARQHAEKLIAENWTGRRIATAAKLAPSVVHRIVNGDVHEVYAATADAILAIPVTPYKPAGGDLLDSTGTARRLQALTALGHPTAKLAADLGVLTQSIGRWRRQYRPHIAAEHHEAVADLYERLSSVPGTSQAAKNEARRHGWVPPLAWDDDTIDDPNARPDLGEDNPDLIDEVAVRRALNGERVRLTPAERDQAFRVGFAAGMTGTAIGERLHMNGGYVRQVARRIRDEQAA